MWRKTLFILIVTVEFAWGASARSMGAASADTPAPGRGDWLPAAQWQLLFAQTLDGRNLVARMYPRIETDPEKFETVTTALAADVVSFAAIRSKSASLTPTTTVLIWAGDQTDPVVAAVLGESVYARSLREQDQFSLWSAVTQRRGISLSWTILDARGEPMRGASVSTCVRLDNGRSEISLDEAVADEQGRVRRWLPLASSGVLMVKHPDYGLAAVEYSFYERETSGTCFVPMAPRNSNEAKTGIQGTVTDSDGRPVPGVIVRCLQVGTPERGAPHQRIPGCAITDEQGGFALCVPTVSEDLEWKGLPSVGTRYILDMEPPKASNLRRPGGYGAVNVLAGSQRTFTLTRMDSRETFHTFGFEYAEGPVTEVEELRKITLTLRRDGREWLRLGYDQWKDGCSLPFGTLQAQIERWRGERFSFEEIKLVTDSPERLVFKALPTIRYRGRVVDADTKEPMPGAFVLLNHMYAGHDAPSLTDEQWNTLRTQATEGTPEQGPPVAYRGHNRVTTTDAQGEYEFLFTPGIVMGVADFAAVAPNHALASIRTSTWKPNAEGIVELPTIGLPPEGTAARGFSDFVFEDEKGPVTDPNRLKDIEIRIRAPDGMGASRRFEDFLRGREFVPGTYQAEVLWNEKYYVFEPVDLTKERPATVVFRPKSITKADALCKGSVIHGVTGEPISGAIVLYNRMPTGGHPADITARQWAAIDALGPKPDVANPALAPLLSLLLPGGMPSGDLIPQVVRTNAQGRFELLRQRNQFSGRGDCLLVLARDFLTTQQQFTVTLLSEGDPTALPETRQIEPDADGVVELHPLKLFPAATVAIHPVLPDPGYEDPRQRLRMIWSWKSENQAAWVKDFWITPRDNQGASVYRLSEVRPNMKQNLYVPAGMDLTISVQVWPESELMPARFRNLHLEQGQVLDLGRVEFQSGVALTVHVVDGEGKPVDGVRVACADEDRLIWNSGALTDPMGLAKVYAPPHSSGRIAVGYYDRQARKGVTEDTPYVVEGQEDAGKKFTLQLSDAFLEQYRKATRPPLDATRRR